MEPEDTEPMFENIGATLNSVSILIENPEPEEGDDELPEEE